MLANEISLIKYKLRAGGEKWAAICKPTITVTNKFLLFTGPAKKKKNVATPKDLPHGQMKVFQTIVAIAIHSK